MSKKETFLTDQKINSETIVNTLRTDIWQGKLKQGQPLRQDEIAERFKVSKIPVREALNQLKVEGLVVLLKNRGAIVSNLSPAELEEIYVMRSALETAALRLALPRLTVADFQRCEEILATLDREREVYLWSDLNWQFHAILYAPAEMPRLLDWIRKLHFNVARYMIFYLADLDFQSSSQQEHRQILAACRAGDLPRATQHLQKHLGNASDHLIFYLNQRIDPGETK